MAIYDYQGNVISDGSSGSVDYDRFVKGIAHRGGMGYATPENTIPNFKRAKLQGFGIVECDVKWTSDEVTVIRHNSTIGGTAISDLTWEQLQQYDLDSSGTKIPKFDDFLALCRNIGLYPYIDIPNDATEARAQGLVDAVKKHGLQGKATYISMGSAVLGYIKDYDATARLGLVVYGVGSGTITACQNLLTGSNEVFVDSQDYSDNSCDLCRNGNIPLEIWTVNDADVIESLNPYITGVTSDKLIAGQVLYDANIS